MEDNQIISLLFARDERALKEITARYGGRMLSMARNICGSAEDADEVFNDALQGVWNAIPPENPAALGPYLYRIVRNLACNAVRKRNAEKRVGTSSFDEIGDELLAAFGPPGEDETESEKLAIRAAIHRFLASSEATDRIIFVRRYFYADAVQEIAGALRMSRPAVTMRLQRMRKRLSEVLKEEEIHL